MFCCVAEFEYLWPRIYTNIVEYMRKQGLMLLAAGTLLMASGCSKKLGQFKSDYFSTNPTPLEEVGAKVPGTVTGTIPPKFMLRNARVTATPVLQWEESANAAQSRYGEAKGTSTLFQGVDVRDNGQVVDFNNGGTVTIPFDIPFQEPMSRSTLYLDFQVDQGGKTYALPRVKVGNGVITTSSLASAATVAPAIAPDSFQQVITKNYSADIHFLINQANIRASELGSQAYIDLNQKLRDAKSNPNMEIAGVSVSSFASPEGSYDFNKRLAEQREVNTTAQVTNQLRKDKIEEFGELTSNFTPEDWDGFQKLVEASNIQDKELILSVLRMYPDPVQREKEIRNLSSVFNELADQILPQLRYSRIQATVKVLGHTDRQMVELFNTDPTRLTADEMLYLATLTDDNFKKMEVYNRVAQQYPGDARGFANLGATQLVAGDKEGARANFEHALRLDSSCKPAQMNLALISMMDGDNRRANEQLGAAAGTPGIADAMGVYCLQTGDITGAVRAFGDSKTNNAAVAQILNRDYSNALRTLQGVKKPDATTYYLMAIVGARTNQQQQVMDNLRQAVKLDRKMLDRAKNDLEFAAYNLTYL